MSKPKTTRPPMPAAVNAAGVTRSEVRSAQSELDSAVQSAVAAAKKLMRGEGTRKEVMSCLQAAAWLNELSADLYYYELNPPRARETPLGKEIKKLLADWGANG